MTQRADTEPDQQHRHAADQLGAEDAAEAILGAHGGQGGHVGKADTEDGRQAGTEAPDTEQLDQRRQRRGHQRNLDQQQGFGGGGADGTGDDDRHRDGTHDHGEDVLQRQWQGTAQRWPAVEVEDRDADGVAGVAHGYDHRLFLYTGDCGKCFHKHQDETGLDERAWFTFPPISRCDRAFEDHKGGRTPRSLPIGARARGRGINFRAERSPARR